MTGATPRLAPRSALLAVLLLSGASCEGGGGAAAGAGGTGRDAGPPADAADATGGPAPDGRLDPCRDVSCPRGARCLAGECVDLYADEDGDGVSVLEDCNDRDPGVHPGAPDGCDGKDNDCDGATDEDLDGDGDGVPGPDCPLPGRPVDCDDTRADVHPGAEDVCDGTDNDCDGETDEDLDEDGDGVSACETVDGVPDCRDDDPHVHPGATEVCDLEDNDCDGETDEGQVCQACSDGERDELVDAGRWPTVAGCAGQFARMSLRTPRTGKACGDDLATPCDAPEDLCGEHWHICMRNGYGWDLRERLTAAECRALSRPYLTASNNCSNPPGTSPRASACDYTEPLGCYPTGWCSAPISCGPAETSHCMNAVWVGGTWIFGLHAGRTEGNGCGSISTSVSYSAYGQGRLAGVLCCADGP